MAWLVLNGWHLGVILRFCVYASCSASMTLADTYERQEADRQYERAQTVPAGFFSERKKPRRQRVDDQVTINRRPRKKTSGSGHCMQGSGAAGMTYRQFIAGTCRSARQKLLRVYLRVLSPGTADRIRQVQKQRQRCTTRSAIRDATVAQRGPAGWRFKQMQ